MTSQGILYRFKKSPFKRLVALKVSRIYPNPAAARRDCAEDSIMQLAESIMRHGILQPLTVRFAGARGENCTDIKSACFELISGERRLRAAKLAGLHEVPCIILDADSRLSAQLSLAENCHRRELSLFEQAAAISSLCDTHGITQEQAGRAAGLNPPQTAARLRLLRLTAPERRLISEYKLSEGHIRALLPLTDPDERLSVIRSVIKDEMGLSQTEELVDKLLCPEDIGTPAKRKPIVRDMRLFYNTVDKAVEAMERAGITVLREKYETDSEIKFIIKIDKSSPK